MPLGLKAINHVTEEASASLRENRRVSSGCLTVTHMMSCDASCKDTRQKECRLWQQKKRQIEKWGVGEREKDHEETAL